MAGDVTFDKGLVLRKSRHLYGPGELLDATNVLPDELAALGTRPGASVVGGQAPAPYHSLHAMWKSDGVKVRYQAYTYLGQVVLLRDFATLVATDLAAFGGEVDFVSAKGYNEDKTYTFFANGGGAFRLKDDGVTTSRWGIDAPPAAPIVGSLGGGGSITAGTRSVVYLYVRKSGATVLHKGNPSLASQVTTIASDRIVAGNLFNPADPFSAAYDPQVTHMWVYRTTLDLPEVFQLDVEIPVTGTIGPLVTTLTQDDETLGEILEQDNNRSPGLISIALHYDHIIGVSGFDNILYVSKRFQLESFPIQNQIEVSSPGEILLMVRSYGGRAIVHTTSRVFEIVGSTDEQQWVAVETTAPTGLEHHCRHSIARGLRGYYWKGFDGIYRWDGSQVTNITDERLWPLFHGQAVNGYAPVVTSPTLLQSGGWADGRYYWAYSTDGVTLNRMLVYDEHTDSWWSDTRGFYRFHFEQRDNIFLASYSDGRVYILNDRTQTTDSGLPITWSWQTRDDDEQAPTSDKELSQVTLEMDTHGSNVTVHVVRNYGELSDVPVFVGATTGRTQIPISTLAAAPTGKALGYRAGGVGPYKLYRVFPMQTTLPMSRRAFRFQSSDLGYRGTKQLTHFTLDADLLGAGLLTAVVKGDGVTLGVLQRATPGRIPPTTLYELGNATLVEVLIESTADFRLWSAELGIIPLPVTRQTFLTQASSLGYRGQKQITHLTLDAELLGPGTLQAEVLGDGVPLGILTRTALGRGIQSITELGEATMLALIIQSTVDFRLWSAEIGSIPLPVPRRTFTTQASSMGYLGKKQLTHFTMDAELLGPGTLSVVVLGDGAAIGALTRTALGRGLQSAYEMGEATLIEVEMSSTVDFRLWSAEIGAIPLPISRQAFVMHPSNLGYQGDKHLTHFTLDAELLTAGTLVAQVFGDVTLRGTITMTGIGRQVQSIYELGIARLVEVRITSTAEFRIWSSEVGSIALPIGRRSFRMTPSDLGYRGQKQLLRLRLDIEILGPGTVTAVVLGDGVVLDTLTITGAGRHTQSLLQSGGMANLVEVQLDGTVDFRLWYMDVSFLPLPEEGYLHQMLATDLGWPSVKIGSWLDLDYELLDAGTLTVTLSVDNVVRFTTQQTMTGRQRTGRLRLPRQAQGRLFALDLSSTGRFRWWGGELAYMQLGQKEGVQRVPLKSAASAEAKVEVLQSLLASEAKVEALQPVLSSESKIEVLQALLASETKIEVLQALPDQTVRIVDVGRQMA